MSVINDRIRNMNQSEKMKYLLNKLTEDMTRTKKEEILEQISKMSRGIEPSEFLKTFGLEGTYDAAESEKDKGISPSITIKLTDSQSVKIELSDVERRWFIDPKPVQPQPPRSVLPQDELDELNANG